MSETDKKRDALHTEYYRVNLAIDELAFGVAEAAKRIDNLQKKRKELFNDIMAFDKAQGGTDAGTPVGPQPALDTQTNNHEPAIREAAPATGTH